MSQLQREPILFCLTLCIYLSTWTVLAADSSCSNTLTPSKSVKPSVASGYQMALIATGLTKPRSIAFDTAGNLMVVESGAGITNLILHDNGGTCLSVREKKSVIKNTSVSTRTFSRVVSHLTVSSSITALLCLKMAERCSPRRQRQRTRGRTTRYNRPSARVTKRWSRT